MHEACIVALMGASGSGKSARARELLREWRPSRLIIVDPMDEYGEFARKCVNIPALVYEMKRGVMKVRYVPTGDPAARYLALLRALPAGLSEWALHPSLGDAEAQAIEPDGWRVRKADCDFLISPQARQTLAEEGIVLVNFRTLQPA